MNYPKCRHWCWPESLAMPYSLIKWWNYSMGDFSPTYSLINSAVQDPDISDQGQIDNPSSPEETKR